MYKIVLLGEGRVGKSSMIKYITKVKFEENEQSTTQASNCKKQIKIDGKMVTLDIWDTAGQEQFHALGPVYYRDADAAVLVYDVTIPETYNKIKQLINELNIVCRKHIVLVIAGNKIDLREDAHAAEANELANHIGGVYMTTSAKNGVNLDKMLEWIATSLVGGNMDTVSIRDGNTTTLLNEEKRSKKCCC